MRQLLSKLSNQEQGQSAIIIAGALIVLIAAVALVVDGGNAYAQRRQLQNALDAGAAAGAIEVNLFHTNKQVNDAIQDYVARNGADSSCTNINSYYVTQDGSGTKFVERGKTLCSYESTNPYDRPPGNISGRPLYGVTVEGKKQFPTYFAGVIGWRQMAVGTDSMRPVQGPPSNPTGTCQAEDIFPLVISDAAFNDLNGDGLSDIIFSDIVSTSQYRFWENKTSNLKFGYTSWNGASSATAVAGFMGDPSNSGRWSKNDIVNNASSSSVNLNNSSIRTQINARIGNGTSFTVPVYDSSSGTSSYKISGFAHMKIVGISANGASTDNRYLDIKFEHFVEPTGGGACPYYGTGSIVPPVSSLTRRLIGTIKLSKITPIGNTTTTETHAPVEVTSVLDISGSMSDPFSGSGSSSKLSAAKGALVSFNNKMKPLEGDKVALSTYPYITSGTRYNYSCTQSGDTTSYYGAETRATLTSGISGVNTLINTLTANGGTPIAAGMREGRLTSVGAGHDASKTTVILLASDGLANIRLSGRWTGFQGNTFSSPTCNADAVQDALDQANIAKGDGNGDGKPDAVIFTIAVGDDFNPGLLQAMASVDTNPSKPHYFRATDSASMQQIYNQIANQVQTISSDSCAVIQTEAFAGGATVNVRNTTTGQSYTVTTTPTGEFLIDNVSPGTFQFTSATVSISGFTYNVFTDGVGGAPLGSNPTVVVGQGAGSYKADLFLKTTDTVTCPGS